MDRLFDISMQRDELKMVLSELCDKLRHGVYNHIFPEKSDRASSKDPKSKCKGGFTRRDVQWRMGKCCLNCEPIGKCHLSIEEFDVFKAMDKALQVVNKPPAEMPEITPDSFDRYIPGNAYNVSPMDIARRLYRFCVGYWCYNDHGDHIAEKEWERAFNDTICIALESIGRPGSAFHKVISMAEKDDFSDGDQKFVEDHPEIEEIINSAIESRDKPVKGEQDVEILVFHAVLLRIDYMFAHDYPGGDMGVYGGVFEGLIDGCLAVSGLLPIDRPKIYDFDDKDEFDHELLEYEAKHKLSLFKFMEDGSQKEK